MNRTLFYVASSGLLCFLNLTAASEPAADQDMAPVMVVALGAAGTEEYGEIFSAWAEKWRRAAEESGATYLEVGRELSDRPDKDLLHDLIATRDQLSPAPLWLIMIGHGTFDGKVAKFNLRGPDVSAEELATWCAGLQRPLIAIHSFSSSGPFLDALSGEQRVVITATRSGAELNYSRFGGYLADALNDLGADLDHDDQVSLLEAYLMASANVARFYEQESRLATEHALLEDNNDGKGTPADFFVGTRVARQAKEGVPDGRVAHRFILAPSKHSAQLSAAEVAMRDALEAEIENLRDRKNELTESDYYRQLESVLIELAELYASPTERKAKR